MISREPTLTVGADSLLQQAPPTLLSLIKKELTLANPQYRDAQKYGRWIGKKLKPWLYFYTENSNGLRFPRGYANQAVLLCRKVLNGKSPQIIDQRRQLPELALSFQGELRPYQQEAFTAAIRRDFGVIESGTGSGKTVIGLAIIAHRQQPTLILVHNKELLYQWNTQIKTFLGIDAGLIGDGHHEIRPVTVAIVNSARNHLDGLPEHFGQICVDECHRVPASLFTEVVTAFDCRFALGLSATAFRRDGLTDLIHIYLGASVYRVETDRLQKSGAVLKPEFIQHSTDFTYGYRGNYHHLLKALTGNEDRNRKIALDIVTESAREKGTVLVVSDRVAHCQALATLLAGMDPALRVGVLTGQLPSEERGRLIADTREGQIDVLISTVQLIGEGFDCSGLRALFLTTPIKFTGRLLQVVGRILRPAEGKTPRVHDYLDPVGVLGKSARTRRLTFEDEPLLIRALET
ncbi:MAG: DEAD/DEAH box helicase [Proteobacteria bacterium]|nr:DEAD/DEAH box helicase [Pseudomonadota bacterium]MBU1687806.1 DEAD/DEAH box helicase [Pseudomonadota bacterium]